MVIAFPPHVVALLRGRMLRPKLERLVTAACSAVPMTSECKGLCYLIPPEGTAPRVRRRGTYVGGLERRGGHRMPRRSYVCDADANASPAASCSAALEDRSGSSRHPSGFMHAVVLRACVHCAPAGPAPAPHDVVARERAHPAPPPAAASDRAAAPRTLSALIRSSRPEPEGSQRVACDHEHVARPVRLHRFRDALLRERQPTPAEHCWDVRGPLDVAAGNAPRGMPRARPLHDVVALAHLLHEHEPACRLRHLPEQRHHALRPEM